MNPLPRITALLAVLLVTASPAFSQLLEYHGNAAIVGVDGAAPALISPASTTVSFSYIFDPAKAPTTLKTKTATYQGAYGLVWFDDGDARYLYNVRLTITKTSVDSSYLFVGTTAEGWDVIHYAYSDSPNFAPNLALPTTTPQFPPGDEYTASYVDVYGPGDTWHAFSDADLWFMTDRLTLVNRARGGIASANRQKLPNEGAAQAFDGLNATKWFSGSAATTGWLRYQFGNSQAWTVIRYDLTSANDAAGRDPRKWQFQGSQDGVTWTTLDTRTGKMFSKRGETRQYYIPNSTAYKYYRLNVLGTRGTNCGVQLAELGLMSY